MPCSCSDKDVSEALQMLLISFLVCAAYMCEWLPFCTVVLDLVAKLFTSECQKDVCEKQKSGI